MKPKLDEIKKMFEKGSDFSLTNSQYLKSTGLDIPKNESYLLNKSLIAREARKKGYIVSIVEKTLVFTKENIL